MKKFFSKQRSVAMLIGLVLGIIFGVMAWSFKESNFWNVILSNLASGALEVPLIASLINFWIDLSRDEKIRKARDLAIDDLKTIDFTLIVALAQIFGFNYEPKDSELKDAKLLLERYADSSRKYVAGIDFEHYKFEPNEGHTAAYVSSLKDGLQRLQTALNDYGFALQEDEKGDILTLKRYIESTLVFKPTIRGLEEKELYKVTAWIIKITAAKMRLYLDELRKHIK